MPKRLRGEEAIHMRAVAELRAANVPFFHCPNEGRVPVQYRAKLRALGLSPGVPDLIIVAPTLAQAQGSHPGAALEIKSETGRTTHEQWTWLERWKNAGFDAAVTRGHAQTARQLLLWGYITVEQRDRWMKRI